MLPAILAAVVLALTACEAPKASAPPTPATLTSPATATYSAPAARSAAAIAQDDWTAAAIANLALGYSASLDVWPGYDPREHPSVAVHKSGAGAVESALAINFPHPERLGDATAISVAGTPFASLHRIDRVSPAMMEIFAEIPHFEFNASLAGVDSFVMIAGGGDEFLNPAHVDWTATFIHEMFHRYQGFRFQGWSGDQDVENYAYTAGNLELATLEERALAAAVAAADATARETAARRFAAIRLVRLQADRRVELDNDQERFEGSARYPEHRLAGEDTRFTYHGGNYDVDLLGDPEAVREFGESVKGYYGFGRFYATGAAILRVLDLLEAAGVAEAVTEGQSPAEVLIEHLGVTPAEAPQLVADARAAYDPRNELPAAAERAAAIAAAEGPVFAD